MKKNKFCTNFAISINLLRTIKSEQKTADPNTAPQKNMLPDNSSNLDDD